MKTFATIAIFATITWARSSAAVAPQQRCDEARISAWKAYSSCIDSTLAKNAKGLSFDIFRAHAHCRHTYFRKWQSFQANSAFVGSTCIGTRFSDNGDQTVTDNLSTLVWEKKDNSGGLHDKSSGGNWSASSGKENGGLFVSFLRHVNEEGFAGSSGWRLPTLSELQTIAPDFPCHGAGLSE